MPLSFFGKHQFMDRKSRGTSVACESLSVSLSLSGTDQPNICKLPGS